MTSLRVACSALGLRDGAQEAPVLGGTERYMNGSFHLFIEMECLGCAVRSAWPSWRGLISELSPEGYKGGLEAQELHRAHSHTLQDQLLRSTQPG